MNACISHHSGISKLDEQHNRLLTEKVQAEKQATELDQKFTAAKTVEERQQVKDDIDSNQHHLHYLNEQIEDTRRAIVDMECSNKENDDDNVIQVSMKNMISSCDNLPEAVFLLEQMMQYAISKAADAMQNATKIQVLI
jgi:hypothetical protein